MSQVSPPASDLWRTTSGEAWVENFERTDRQLDPLGRELLAKLAVRASERALDVGCGCGQTTLELAELCGPSGRVVGVDVSAPMLEVARRRVELARLANVELVLANAETHPFAARSFDLVFSRFGVMFFDEPRIAFENFRAALVEGGRLGFVCWQAPELNPWVWLPLTAALAALEQRELPALLRSPSGPFSFADAGRVRAILSGAGFMDVEIEPLVQKLHVGGAPTLDEAVAYLLRIGPTARALEGVDRALLPRAQAAIREALQPYVDSRGVWLEGALFSVTARKPGAGVRP